MIALLEYVEELEELESKAINQAAIKEASEGMDFNYLADELYAQSYLDGFEAGAKWIRGKAND